MIYNQLGQKYKALEDFNQSIKLDNNHADYYLERILANLYESLMENEIAHKHYEIFVNKYEKIICGGEEKNALQDYNESINLDSSNSKVFKEIAKLLLKSRRSFERL